MNRIAFLFFVSVFIVTMKKSVAQPFNEQPMMGIAVPGIVSPKVNNEYLRGWGVHYSACEMPTNLYAGSAINSITFELNSPLPASAPFQVRLKIRNAFDVHPLCQLQYPRSWEETWNAGDNPILCSGSFDPTQSTLKLTLPPDVFLYQGGGLEILRDSSSADYFFSMKGYYDQQNMAMWDNNNMRYLLNHKPIIKINAVPPTSAPTPSAVSIQNCSGASSFTRRQNICFYLDNWRLTQSQVISSINQYQWGIYSASNLATSLYDVTTSNSYLELTSTILSGLPLTVTNFVLKCSAEINTNIVIAPYYFQISNDVSTSPTEPPSESGSVISRMKIGKKTPEMSVYVNMMESESYPLNTLLSRSQLSLPFQNIEVGNVPTDASPILYANALQNSIPEFEPGDMMRLELTMNKAMKPMLNHRAYINFDWDADQKFDSLLIFTLTNTNGSYQLPPGASGSSIANLIGGTSNEIVYSTDVFIPCDRVKEIPVKFRSGLQRLPTGWNDGEEYAIKTLCPVPNIGSTAINPLCDGETALLTASAGGCVGEFTWYKMPDLTNSISVGASFNATESGDYVVKFTIPGECSRFSLEFPVIFSDPIPSPIVSGNSLCGPGSVILSGTSTSGNVVDWYSSISGGTFLFTGISYTTPSLSSTTTYYAEARNSASGCLSLTRSAVIATINTPTGYYADNDGDGSGAGVASNLCSNPGAGYVINNTDCNDSNVNVFPGALETCNGVDDDCDSNVDDGLSFVNYYNDVDGDGYGAGAATNACQSPGASYVSNNTDCNDSNVNVFPGALETCNGVDDDCDSNVDDGLSFVNYYNDIDGDGYGAGAATNACQSPGASYVNNNTDCNDALSAVNPGASETCNSVDDDCDGVTDEGCTLGSLISATEITTLPQFGLTGGNYSQNVNMAAQTDTPEYGGTYPEKWFKFMAQSNAVRIAVTGASSTDDNAIAIYDDPGLSYTTPLIPIDVADAVNLSSSGVSDQGNEILLTDQLVEGNTYYVVVATVNGTAGNINVKFNTLLPSSCDIAAYTGGTNTYSNVCSNFKCRYRQNAKQGIVHRWASNTTSGIPLQSYTIPPTSIMFTVCQLAKFVPANISGIAQTIYVSADVQYELADAAGVIHYLTAVSTTTCSFTLNPEASIGLRSTDACPNFKTTMSSMATDRSVCGTMQYQWEFTMAYPSPGLPTNVSGSVGGSRILAASSIPGIANGQRYDVRIRALHNDAVTYSGWSASSSCFKTLGAAGMAPWSSNEEQKVDAENGAVSLYPNPSLQGKGAILRSSDTIESIQIFNSSGQLLAKANGSIEQGFLELPTMADAGLYWVLVKSGDDVKRLAWLVQ